MKHLYLFENYTNFKNFKKENKKNMLFKIFMNGLIEDREELVELALNRGMSLFEKKKEKILKFGFINNSLPTFLKDYIYYDDKIFQMKMNTSIGTEMINPKSLEDAMTKHWDLIEKNKIKNTAYNYNIIYYENRMFLKISYNGTISKYVFNTQKGSYDLVELGYPDHFKKPFLDL